MKRSTAMFILSVLTAVGAGVIATSVLVKASQTETVVVATHDLQPYTQIQPSDVKTITFPKNSGMTGLATSTSAVVGHYLSFPVPKGNPITDGSLNSAKSFSAFLTNYVEKSGKPGMLLALPVQSTLSHVVNSGENIALIVRNQSGSEQNFQTIEPVPVLSVLQATNSSTPAALLVFVTEQDYNVLAPAILNNNVEVGLIPQNNSFTAPQAIQLAPVPLQPGQQQAGNAETVRQGQQATTSVSNTNSAITVTATPPKGSGTAGKGAGAAVGGRH